MVERRTLRLAHRGDHRRAAENTIAAMLAALRVPACDGLEFDVRAAVDGVPVLLHDETLARVQGRPDRVDRLGVSELAAAGVPTLAAVLAAIPRSVFLDIELKGPPSPQVVPVLRAGRGVGLAHSVISSFDAAALEIVGREEPAWPRWLNTVDLGARAVSSAVDLGCRGIAADWRTLDETGIERAHT
ncbi:MAG: glycerophosphodiester phosphodiesterase, partial [Chloroflexi bacterium]|nr:glycerophosphodiester phosphodiesterase [Chloroflexota bacterium]